MAVQPKAIATGRCAKQSSGKFVAGVLLNLRRHARLRRQLSPPSTLQRRRNPVARLPSVQEPHSWSAVVPDVAGDQEVVVEHCPVRTVKTETGPTADNADCRRSLTEFPSAHLLRPPTAINPRASKRPRQKLPQGVEQRHSEPAADKAVGHGMPHCPATPKAGNRSSSRPPSAYALREMDQPSFLQLEDFNEKFLSKERGHYSGRYTSSCRFGAHHRLQCISKEQDTMYLHGVEGILRSSLLLRH
mmetsp:Transcript_40455/g.73135  ORF Transcript_40455/g.73135 Transcript_40455/m.73135 type:complete len:245 (+) Transcript_40455:85-819(+)